MRLSSAATMVQLSTPSATSRRRIERPRTAPRFVVTPSGDPPAGTSAWNARCSAIRPRRRSPFAHLLYRADACTEGLQGGLLSTLGRVSDLLQRSARAFRGCARDREARVERCLLRRERGAQRRLGAATREVRHTRPPVIPRQCRAAVATAPALPGRRRRPRPVRVA